MTALAALFFSALVISVIFAIIPLCNNVLVLAIAMAVSGLAMGVIDTIANIQLVTIYQKDSAVFLQVKKYRHDQNTEIQWADSDVFALFVKYYRDII